jgi:hypothetical protein
MDIQTAGKTIQLILAPVVMVTACGLLLTGMLGHYASINGRIRQLSGERLRLALLPVEDGQAAFAAERVAEIDHQVPMLVDRHRLVHHAILLAESAVAVLVVSMFVIAAAALRHSADLGTVALYVFLVGPAALMSSAVFMAIEVRTSHQAVSYEALRSIHLPVPWMAEAAPLAGPRR